MIVAATVTDVAFLGSQRTVRLESKVVGSLVASTGGGTRAPELGSEVGVTFKDEHSWAVPGSRARGRANQFARRYRCKRSPPSQSVQRLGSPRAAYLDAVCLARLNALVMAEARGPRPGGKPETSPRHQLIAAVAERADMTKADTKRALAALDEVVLEELSNAQKVRVGGLVQLTVRVKPAQKKRKGRNPATGEEIDIAAKPASVDLRARPLAKAKGSLPSVQKARLQAGRELTDNDCWTAGSTRTVGLRAAPGPVGSLGRGRGYAS